MSPQYSELAEAAGGFIHEIKNHLGTLQLNLQLLAEDFDEPASPKERRILGRINKLETQCRDLVGVANDFLRFARVRDLNLAQTDLGKLLDEMIDFFGPTAQAGKVEIKSFVPADLPPMPLDRDLIKQALLNLLLNAAQAMPEGGDITIQAAKQAATAGNGRAGQPTHVIVHVIDTGAGMQPNVRARVFEPFFSTREAGNGLGLPTTKRIIEAHGGTIDVESESGKGTQFTVRLPIVSP